MMYLLQNIRIWKISIYKEHLIYCYIEFLIAEQLSMFNLNLEYMYSKTE